MINNIDRLSIVGVGPSDNTYIYPLAMEEIKNADVLAGSLKIIGRFKNLLKKTIEYKTDFGPFIKEIEKVIENKKVVVLVSGDPGFYSLSSLIVNYFKPAVPKIFPGISSLQMAYARIGKSWNNIKIYSVHGRCKDIKSILADDNEIAILMDGKCSSHDISHILCALGYRERGIYLCTRLGFPDEKISYFKASNFSNKYIASNSIMILEAFEKRNIKFYGIGVGIGGPDMITLKAVKALNSISVLCVPKSEQSSYSLAFTSVRKFISEKTEILEFEYPMIKDREVILKYWQKTSNVIIEKIESGNIVAFITIGDPLIYSTYNYVLGILKKRISAHLIETIPGINSFSYAVSKLQKPLLEKDEKMAVLPCNRSLEGYSEKLREFDTVILMKIGKNLKKVIELIYSSKREDESYFFRDMGFKNEMCGIPIKNINNWEKGYLSTIIIMKEKISGGQNES